MLQLGRMDAVQAETQSFQLVGLLDLEESEAKRVARAFPESNSNYMCLKLSATGFHQFRSGPK